MELVYDFSNFYLSKNGGMFGLKDEDDGIVI
jgi:hypothetical protein